MFRQKLGFGPILKAVVCFEFLFVLFLNAGEVKSLPLLARLSQYIDFTAVLMILSFAVGLFILIMRKSFPVPTGSLKIFTGFIFFLLAITISYSVTLSDEVSTRKLVESWTILLWVFLAMTFIVNTPNRIATLYLSLGIAGVVIAIGLLYRIANGDYLQHAAIGAFGGGYQRAGILCGLNILLSMFVIQQFRNYRLSGIFVLILSIVGLIFTAHRSTWIAMVVALLAISLVSNNQYARQYRFKTILSVLLVGVLAFGLISVVPRAEALVNRFSDVSAGLTPGQEGVGNPRLMLYEYSIRKIFTSPGVFVGGIGFGNFLLVSGTGYRHTHNLFLEFFIELGVFGFVLALVFIFYWRRIKVGISLGNEDRKLEYVSELVFWYFLAHTMFGGDIADNRMFWVVLFALYNFKFRMSHDTRINDKGRIDARTQNTSQ